MEQRDGVRLGRVAADDEDGLGIVDVVVGVGHGAVAPCVGNPRHGGGVADPGLVVDVVGAPVARELAEEIGLFVAVLGRAEPVDAVGAAFLADRHHAVADLVDRLFPRDALPLAALFLHRVLEAAFAVGVFTHRGALGAVGAEVERAVPAGFLAGPDAILHFGDDGAAHGAVGADGFLEIDGAGRGGGGVGLLDRSAGCGDGSEAADGQTRAAQEGAAVNRGLRHLGQDRSPLGASRNPVGLFPKHVSLSLARPGIPAPACLALTVTLDSRASRNQSPSVG